MATLRDWLAARGEDTTAHDNFTAWRAAGYTGPVNDAGDPAQEEDCDPRVWTALTTGGFRKPGDPRNPR